MIGLNKTFASIDVAGVVYVYINLIFSIQQCKYFDSGIKARRP